MSRISLLFLLGVALLTSGCGPAAQQQQSPESAPIAGGADPLATYPLPAQIPASAMGQRLFKAEKPKDTNFADQPMQAIANSFDPALSLPVKTGQPDPQQMQAAFGHTVTKLMQTNPGALPQNLKPGDLPPVSYTDEPVHY